ncbi:MAG: PAS domain-containing sensor histidine kinase, partial [Bacteroidota bacterium]|nr:PAS domain-containing sensor histidine kinase [Bacteroidota bacterium]
YMDVNQTILNLTGRSKEDFLNNDFGISSSWSLPGEKEKIISAIQKAAQGESIRQQVRIISLEKDIKIIDISIKPFSYKKGEINFIMLEGRDITEIVKANEEIKGKNKLIEGLLENFPIILMKINKKTEISYMSGLGLKGLGYNENELIGTKVLNIFPQAEDELNRVLAGETRNFEGRVKINNLINHFFNYYFYDEAIECVVGISVDVTPQKEAEQQVFEKNIELIEALNRLTVAEEHLIKVNEELELMVEERTYELRKKEKVLQQTLEQALELNELLKERELFLSSVIDQSPVSTFITDDEGTQIRINDACLKLFNVPDASLSLNKYNIFKDENLLKNPFYNEIQDVFTKGKVLRLEIDYNLNEVSHLDITTSKPLSFIATMFPIMNRHGRVTNAVIQHQDITVQKQSVEKIKESAERFRMLLETIPQMAFTALPDGTNNYFNDRWFQYTGQTHENSLGIGWKSIIHPDDLVLTESKWKHSIETGKIYEQENRFKRVKDEMYRWHLSRAVPIKNASEKIILWVGTITDIHDHRLAEEQLLAKNLELAKINADLDNFIYTASHDLKSPVTNLEGLTSLLHEQLENHLTEMDKRLFDMMKVSISKFKNTITGLVEITKAQKNLEEKNELVYIPDVIQDVLLNVEYLIKESKVSIRQELKVKKIKYAKVNFNSILYNLISNAIKYRSSERNLIIIIRSYIKNDRIILEVEDNGLGIPLNKQGKLFTMFKRLHSHVEGTGIGLYIIKRIVENNGGTIRVESEEGKGTKFIISFFLGRRIGR